MDILLDRRFTWKYATKHKHRFEEDVPDGEEATLGTVYLTKEVIEIRENGKVTVPAEIFVSVRHN